jgi:hypothetical protein
MQSQIVLDRDIIASQAVAPIVPTAPTAPTAPIELAAPILTGPIESTTPVSTASLVPKQLSPHRPEVLIQAYLAEKAAWLAQHPTIRPTEYRKARKLKTPRPKVLKEQVFYMPRERRNLTGAIIADKANWTNEEIMVWLDNEDRRQEEEYNRLELEFIGNGNRFTKNGIRDIWARVDREYA